jgi:hypothetical protein
MTHIDLGFKDTAVRFIPACQIIAEYEKARAAFYRYRNLYIICRAHCQFGGAWPNLTRKNKVKAEKAARSCRNWQKMKNNLERMRAAAM